MKNNPISLKRAKSLYLLANLHIRNDNNKDDHFLAENYINQALNINISLVGEEFVETADCYHALGRIKAMNRKSLEF